MLENSYKVAQFRRALSHGPVTVHFDAQVAGVVCAPPRDREVRQHIFDATALVTEAAVRTATDRPLVYIPWAAVIAVSLEEAGALYFVDKDADARRQNHGRHLRLVKEVA